MNRVEELDLYKEYKFAYDKAHELEFFDKFLSRSSFGLPSKVTKQQWLTKKEKGKNVRLSALSFS